MLTNIEYNKTKIEKLEEIIELNILKIKSNINIK